MKIEIPPEVIEKYRYITVEDFDWWSYTVDYWKSEKLPQIGHGVENIYFDSYPFRAEFKGINSDLDILIDRHKVDFIRFIFPDLIILQDHTEYIYQSGGIYTPNYHGGTGDDVFDEKIERLCGYINALIADEIKDLQSEFSKEIEQEYDYLTSDEAVIDSIIAYNLYTPDDDDEEQKAA